jgi:hypothetical protein
MFLLIPFYRQKSLRGSNSAVTGFRTFIYGALALFTWPLSFSGVRSSRDFKRV